MVMKTGFLASAAIAAAMLMSVPATSSAVSAAEYTTILLEKVVNRTPDQTWSKIGPYCSIATWLKVTCVITTGNGSTVGSNRLLNGTNNEIMVASTPWSYTYTQPSTTILYHGTLAVEPLDRGRQTRIVYTLFYDQAPLGTDQAKAENRATRTKRFNEALDAMKAMAESP
jgi:Polyketide cyclase / dehydrase and lipid transport